MDDGSDSWMPMCSHLPRRLIKTRRLVNTANRDQKTDRYQSFPPSARGYSFTLAQNVSRLARASLGTHFATEIPARNVLFFVVLWGSEHAKVVHRKNRNPTKVGDANEERNWRRVAVRISHTKLRSGQRAALGVNGPSAKDFHAEWYAGNSSQLMC